MASGNQHAIASGALGALGGLSLALTGTTSGPAAAAFGAGALVGIVLTPDLDLQTGSISQRSMGRFGLIVATFWRMWWIPYAALLGHRSFWSHTPVIGTVIRLVYVGLIPAFIGWLLSLLPFWPELWGNALIVLQPVLDFVGPWLPALQAAWPLALLGLLLSDLLHWIMDR